MFYPENEIISRLKCLLCNEIYYEPRVLPCGNVICTECSFIIKEYQINSSNEFICRLCNEIHQMPWNGLAICKPLQEIAQLKSNEIYRSDLVQELKVNINEIETKLAKHYFELNNGVDVIKEYCCELRRLSQLAAETAIKEIHDLNDKHIAQIDTYELDKINEFKLTNRGSLNDDLNQFKLYCEQCKAFLNQANITDNEVKTLNQRFKEIKLKLLYKDSEIKSLIFNDDLLELKNASVRTQFGELISTKYSEIDFHDLRILQIGMDLDDDIEYFKCDFLKNGTLAMSFASDNELRLLTLVQHNSRCKDEILARNIDKNFKMFVSNDKIVFEYLVAADDVDDSNNMEENLMTCLVIYDSDSIELLDIVDFKYKLIGVNNDYIFCATNDRNDCSIVVYNYNLDLIKKIGQTKISSDPFYFPANINALFNRDCKYFTRTNAGAKLNEIRCVDETSGNLLQRIFINKLKYFTIDSNGNVITIESVDDFNILKFCDSNGSVLKQVKLKNFPKNKFSQNYICFTGKGELCYVNPLTLSIHYQIF